MIVQDRLCGRCGEASTATGRPVHKLGCPALRQQLAGHGWICPVCDGGVAPGVSRCPCRALAGAPPLAVEVVYQGEPGRLLPARHTGA